MSVHGDVGGLVALGVVFGILLLASLWLTRRRD